MGSPQTAAVSQDRLLGVGYPAPTSADVGPLPEGGSLLRVEIRLLIIEILHDFLYQKAMNSGSIVDMGSCWISTINTIYIIYIYIHIQISM